MIQPHQAPLQAHVPDAAPAGDVAAPFLGWRGGLVILAFWTLYGMVTTAGLFFSPIRESSGVPAPLMIVPFLGAYTWAVLTLPLLWLTRALNVEGGHRVWRFAALALAALTIAALVSVSGAYVSWMLLQYFVGFEVGDGDEVWLIARFRFLNDLLACLLVLAAGVARDYFLRYQARQREASQLRAQLVESRLQFLRAQLNPHFLSNTMNAVSALVSKDPKGVRRMLARLSELLRYTLEAPSEPEIVLEQELAVLQRYLEILEIRFQGRLRTSVQADPDVLDALVPNLILQPLAENAMEHGVSQAGGTGAIDVRAFRSDDQLVLRVEDTGGSGNGMAAPDGDSASAPGGYGLRHARDRLEQLYGASAVLELRPTEQGGMVAEIRLPLRFRTLDAVDAQPTASHTPSHA